MYKLDAKNLRRFFFWLYVARKRKALPERMGKVVMVFLGLVKKLVNRPKKKFFYLRNRKMSSSTRIFFVVFFTKKLLKLGIFMYLFNESSFYFFHS